ncbi:histidine phosphatase family protein [Staphylococcus edaphicus]|uniref:phosphoglycerate mutase (2,3-diphosphoglycerate-dependent) n=1 Tax=Staphylococcus edaphicus TaxID=1955013 RepID=A0A2C6WM77_9STAP|nr:histidine phosphatase family protein [Staphylococcus edaphicus]PHK48547.1 histidine phosphatase family protein [Staphylococcus edaphicus]UQW81425.1 histidine phosphatase family protein [Staphylococcus edaphicus]
MKIYLIRHGESQSNYDKKQGINYFCGQLDVSLTERGTNAAQLLQTDFENKSIDHIYISDLLRTRQTYNAIFDKFIPVSVTSLLRERSLGLFEGKMIKEVEEDPKYKHFFENENYADFRHSFTQKAPEGESYADVLQRVRQFFENEVDDSFSSIAIVAHQVVIRCCLVYLGYETEETVIDKKIENCVPYEVEK